MICAAPTAAAAVAAARASIVGRIVTIVAVISFVACATAGEICSAGLPLFLVFFIGFIGMIVFKRPIGLALKDVFHFIKPIQGILIGYFFYQLVDNKKVFFQAIIKAALISASIHIFIVLFFTHEGLNKNRNTPS